MLGLAAALRLLGGLFGIGGGIIVIPLLVLGFGLDQAVAQGIALVIMVANLLIGWCRCNCWPITRPVRGERMWTNPGIWPSR